MQTQAGETYNDALQREARTAGEALLRRMRTIDGDLHDLGNLLAVVIFFIDRFGRGQQGFPGFAASVVQRLEMIRQSEDS